MSAATITLRIDIETARHSVPNETRPNGSREALGLGMNYRLAMSIAANVDTKGEIVGGYELARDAQGNYYAITAREATGQVSMFGEDEE